MPPKPIAKTIGFPKQKKITVSKAKAKAWKAFSEYVRVRDCIATTGDTLYGKCITCEQSYLRSLLQAGHLVGGRSNAILFDEQGCNAQCYSCNIIRKGNGARYTFAVDRKYGAGTAERLVALDDKGKIKPVQYKVHQLLEMAEQYKQRTKELMESL